MLVFSYLRWSSVERDFFAEKYKDEWVIFREWGYINKNDDVRMYVELILSKFISEQSISIIDLFQENNVRYSFLSTLSSRRRDQFQIDRDEYVKHLLLRDILGLHKLFHDNVWDVVCYKIPTIIPYLIQNPVFKALYDKELEALKKNYKQLLMLSKVIKYPDTAEHVIGKLRESKQTEFREAWLRKYAWNTQ